jgi:hypothetical protein
VFIDIDLTNGVRPNENWSGFEPEGGSMRTTLQ